MQLQLMLLAAAGGAIGSALRYLVNTGLAAWLGPRFPWWTFAVNVTGSLLMGLIAGLAIGREGELVPLRVFLTTGVLGGYTTFSAFSLDFAMLAERGETAAALSYAGGSVVLSITACFLGLWLARALG